MPGARTPRHATSRDLAEEVRGACLGMRVARLHRVISRVYDQALQLAGLSLPQMEILTVLISTAGPVRPADLAGEADAGTVRRCQPEPRPDERARLGHPCRDLAHRTGHLREHHRHRRIRVTSASTAWRSAQASAAAVLGPAAASTLGRWLGLHAETPASSIEGVSYQR